MLRLRSPDSAVQLLPVCSINLCLLAERSPEDKRSELPGWEGREAAQGDDRGHSSAPRSPWRLSILDLIPSSQGASNTGVWAAALSGSIEATTCSVDKHLPVRGLPTSTACLGRSTHPTPEEAWQQAAGASDFSSKGPGSRPGSDSPHHVYLGQIPWSLRCSLLSSE